MLFTLFVAVLAATLWALRSFFFDAGAPHDASTLELASIGLVTLVTYRWMKRLQAIRGRGDALIESVVESVPPASVSARYAEATTEAELEKKSLAEQVA